MDGLTFLRKLMAQYPLPVVIISSVIDVESPDATDILQAGAMDVISLPKAGARAHIFASADAIRRKLKSAVQRRLRIPAQLPSQTVSPKLTADAILPPPHRRAKVNPTEPVVWIGASTGGNRIPASLCWKCCLGTVRGSLSSSTCPNGSQRPSPAASTRCAKSPSRKQNTTTRYCRVTP